MEATQEFNFDPRDGRKVVPSTLRNGPSTAQLVRCVDFGQGKLQFMGEATVIVEAKFVDPGKGPSTRVVYQNGPRAIVNHVREHVERYRMPCLVASEGPLVATQRFRFKYEDNASYRLKDMHLTQFLQNVENLQLQKVRFDFNTMGCPFELEFQPYQPYARNRIGELESANPNRREFIEWLVLLKMDLPAKVVPHVIGEEMRIAVPCMVIDLT